MGKQKEAIVEDSANNGSPFSTHIKPEIDLYDPLRLSFVNVNTPEDWARVQSELAKAAP